MKMRAFSSQSEYNVLFPKSILGFQFWTFLKMSIFQNPLDFLFESCLETHILIFRQINFLRIMLYITKN